MMHELVVGILASRTKAHAPAHLGSEATHQFLGSQLPRGIHIGGDIDALLVAEVEVIEPVHPVGIGVSARGYAHHALKSRSQEGERIHLALGHDHLVVPQAGVDQVRDELSAMHHLEVLLG